MWAPPAPTPRNRHQHHRTRLTPMIAPSRLATQGVTIIYLDHTLGSGIIHKFTFYRYVLVCWSQETLKNGNNIHIQLYRSLVLFTFSSYNYREYTVQKMKSRSLYESTPCCVLLRCDRVQLRQQEKKVLIGVKALCSYKDGKKSL